MTAFLLTLHPWLGYLVSLVLLLVALTAFRRAKDAAEFRPGMYVAAMVLLDILVLTGLIIYGVTGAWDARPEIAYLHPTAALVALAVGHALLGRAKRTQMAVDAHRSAGRGLLAALVLLLVAIGIASAPSFL